MIFFIQFSCLLHQSEFHHKSDLELLQFVSELVLHDPVGAFFGAVSGADKVNSGLSDFMCQKTYLAFRFVEKVKSSDQGVNALVGKRGADFADDIDRASMRTTVQNHKPLIRVDHKALFMCKVVRLPSFFRAAVHHFAFADCIKMSCFVWYQITAFPQLAVA